MSMIRLPLIFLAVCVVAGPAVAQERSQPRQRLLMDYGWSFTTGDPAGAEQPGFDDTGWRSVDLPHDWSIEGPYDQNAPTGGRGGYLPTGVGWYRRIFTVPGGASGRRVTIEFDGVYQNSDVWVNGHHLGSRPYGYISFAYDLTPYLVGGENVLAVRVDNSHQPNTRWYSGSGIYRHVWLVVTDHLHIGHWGTFITTPEVDTAAALVNVGTRIVNEGASERSGTLRSVILDASGREVAGAESRSSCVWQDRRSGLWKLPCCTRSGQPCWTPRGDLSTRLTRRSASGTSHSMPTAGSCSTGVA